LSWLITSLQSELASDLTLDLIQATMIEELVILFPFNFINTTEDSLLYFIKNTLFFASPEHQFISKQLIQALKTEN